MFAVISVAGAVLGLHLIGPESPPSWVEGFDNSVNAPIALLTFVVALFLAGNRGYTNWKDLLELRMSVLFIYVNQQANDDQDAGEKSADNKTAELLIEDAPLAGLSDARAWAQSLGQLLPYCGSKSKSGNNRAHFDLGFFKIDGPEIQHRQADVLDPEPGKKGYLRRVFVTFYMTSKLKVAPAESAGGGLADKSEGGGKTSPDEGKNQVEDFCVLITNVNDGPDWDEPISPKGDQTLKAWWDKFKESGKLPSRQAAAAAKGNGDE